MVYWVFKFIFTPILKIIWIKKIEGLSNIPKRGPFVIAANHSSYFDFLILPAIFPMRIYFLAAEKFFDHPVWRIIMKLTGQIKVDRKADDKTDVYKKALEVLNDGGVLCIFPEGTRSSTRELQRAYCGVSKISYLSKTVILPVAIKNTYDIMSRHDRMPKFTKTCEIVIREPIPFSVPPENVIENDFHTIRTGLVMRQIANALGVGYRY